MVKRTKQRETAQRGFETFRVYRDPKTGKVVCDPLEVTLKPNDPNAADSVRWEVAGLGEGERVVVKWEVASPFLNLEAIPGKEPDAVTLVGSGNTCEAGVFKFGVYFVDEHGHAVGMDPKVFNDPTPPIGY